MLPAPVRASALWSLSQLDALLRKEVGATIERAQIPGLNLRGYWALEAIAASSRLTQSELSEVLGIDRSDMVRLMDTLQEAGLAERTRDEADRRRQLISLTGKGEKVRSSLRRATRRAERSACAACPEDVAAKLRDWLAVQEDAPDSDEQSAVSDTVLPTNESEPENTLSPAQNTEQTPVPPLLRKPKKKKKRNKKKKKARRK